MKCRSSSKQEKMESEKLGNLKVSTPHLSGAYIRSLVKQLTTSRTKDHHPSNDAHHDQFNAQNTNNFVEQVQVQQQPPQPPPQQHKKQVRRRLHTTRPYQERLLNMAEARREIVTALKFHRANMKQAKEQQQRRQQKQVLLLQQQEELQQQQQQEDGRIYPSSYSSYNFPPHPPNPFPWSSSSSSSPIPPFPLEPVNFGLPNQTLGLNLNFHDFNNINTTPYYNINNNPSSSSPTTSSSPGLSGTTTTTTSEEQHHPSTANPDDHHHVVDPYGGCGLHHAMDDQEIAEIRSIGERHQMEWNDTMNLMTSAWWFKKMRELEFHYQPFDQGMELGFPSWLNGNENCFQQQHLDSSPEDYFHDPALPCMEIEEIEGIDGEWLA